MPHTFDLDAINDPGRSRFNPMSQTFVDQAHAIHRMTLDPDIGGSSYIPHTASILPVYYPPDRSKGNPNVYVVGGAQNPDTGKRFETHSALSHEQFTTGDVERNMLRAGIAAHQTGRKDLSAGTWAVTSSKRKVHPREGEVDMDVSDIHTGKTEALQTATERGEETIFANQGAREFHTVHSPKHPKYDPNHPKRQKTS